jgi:heme/copper-type cytochrome/quinol oxidase subunit 1
MGFFKKYNGTTDTRLVRLERLTWLLIYLGLVVLVLGSFMQRMQPATGWFAAGGVAVVSGIVLIYVRSRMRENKLEILK